MTKIQRPWTLTVKPFMVVYNTAVQFACGFFNASHFYPYLKSAGTAWCLPLVWSNDNGTTHFKNVNNYLNTNIYSYLETSGGQSSNLYLNVVHFFNTRVNQTSVATEDYCFPALVSNMRCSSSSITVVDIQYRTQAPYSKHFIFFVTYELAQISQSVTLHKAGKACLGKHSCLLGPSVSYQDKDPL